MKNNGTIYAMLCPLAKKIVYVGQTTMGLSQKLKLAKTHTGGNYGQWIASLKEAGQIDNLEIVPLERNVSLDIITEREKFWINFCNNEHPLINKNLTPFEVRRGKGNPMSRYFTIDSEIKINSPTLEDLSLAVSLEEGGLSCSKRTIQADLYDMRYSETLQFFAPIEYNKVTKVYYYSDPEYSILRVIVDRYYKPKNILKIA